MECNDVVFKSALIVEDCHEQRNTMSLFMSHQGFAVKTCSTRDEALLVLRHEKFSCLLLDYKMPGMSAEFFIPLIRTRYPLMPIILLTASPDAYELSSKLGVSGVIPKPFDIDFLFSALERILEGKKVKHDREVEDFNHMYAKTLERLKSNI